jgi:hypothetical protein
MIGTPALGFIGMGLPIVLFVRRLTSLKLSLELMSFGLGRLKETQSLSQI